MLPKQENLSLARQLSLQALSNADPAERAACSGSRMENLPEGRRRIGFRYLGREVGLSLPGGTIEVLNGGPPVAMRDEVLILHYLERAPGKDLAGTWISFAEIPGGGFYHSVFRQRCQDNLVRHFGEEPDRLLAVAGSEMKGEAWRMGDVSVLIWAFPRVPLGLVLWKGDEEFPPAGNILFDSSIPAYLPVEDIVVLTETVVWKLVKSKNV